MLQGKILLQDIFSFRQTFDLLDKDHHKTNCFVANPQLLLHGFITLTMLDCDLQYVTGRTGKLSDTFSVRVAVTSCLEFSLVLSNIIIAKCETSIEMNRGNNQMFFVNVNYLNITCAPTVRTVRTSFRYLRRCGFGSLGIGGGSGNTVRQRGLITPGVLCGLDCFLSL